MKAQKSLAIALTLVAATITATSLQANSQDVSNSNTQSSREQIESTKQTNGSCRWWGCEPWP